MTTVDPNSVLTVLTDPVPYGRYLLTEAAKKLLRSIRNVIRPRIAYLSSPYRGHFAVTRSLVEGLKAIGAKANYNPRSLSVVGETVIVLSGVPALRQAIKLKQAGRVRHILAGPNILVFPSEHGGVISSPEIDFCITPCELTCQMYIKDCPSLRGRCIPWPAGIDTNQWRPSSEVMEQRTILVYEKQVKGPVGPIDEYVQILVERGYHVEVVKYGQYSTREYLQKLQRAALMVGFTRDESQGLAWAEAWSANVPTLIWRNEQNSYQGRIFSCSTAPYLSAETGRFFNGLSDFPEALTYWEQHQQQFKPREWVLENMSDEVCARKLLNIAASLRKGIE